MLTELKLSEKNIGLAVLAGGICYALLRQYIGDMPGAILWVAVFLCILGIDPDKLRKMMRTLMGY